MRQIRIEAGQKNEAAVQYHFGDRMGVIHALAERHTPKIVEIQESLEADIRARIGRRRPSLHQLVELFVRPLAEYSRRGASARAWIKIIAELTADPRLSLDTLRDSTPKQTANVGFDLFERLAKRMPAQVASQRLWAVAQFHIHICADRARLQDDPDAARLQANDDAFVANLVDMAVGALTAPVSAAARRVGRDGQDLSTGATDR